ncbi:hypothetical protein DL769_002064 [Monosporascus sp. CRB-8-3]|nr:hypothetical protein DL769_002064 [Monosporascus sp. CRB-8-3]
MDGVPMKELSVSPKAAVLFKPQISKQGENLAHDEPYIIRDGSYREVVIHTAEHVHHFRPENLGFGDYFYRGEQWRVIRSYFDPAYTHNTGLAMLPAFHKEVAKWLNTLKNDSLRAGVGRLVVHVPTSCKVLTLRVIPQSFYGEAYDDDASLGLFLHYGINGLLYLQAYVKLDRVSQLQAQALKYAKGFAIPAEHAFKGVQPDNAMSMEQYLQTIDEMLFTNIEVTGSILTFMLTQLAKHQDFQQRLYEEIVAQKAEEGFNVRNYVTQQTTLLHYLTLESVRLRPATWFSAPECITIDKVIGRYKLPARTPVVIDVRRLNTNALTWGPDATEFRPERFASLSPNEYRYGYMRFGVVSGKCLGKHMADILMKVALITILEQYRIEEVEMNIGVKDGDLAFIKRK